MREDIIQLVGLHSFSQGKKTCCYGQVLGFPVEAVEKGKTTKLIFTSPVRLKGKQVRSCNNRFKADPQIGKAARLLGADTSLAQRAGSYFVFYLTLPEDGAEAVYRCFLGHVEAFFQQEGISPPGHLPPVQGGGLRYPGQDGHGSGARPLRLPADMAG